MRTPVLQPRGPRGFTLTELLVVIGIIVVLAALLLPFLQSSTLSAENVKCVSNLRTIAGGLQAYSMEIGGLPGPFHTGQSPYYNREIRRLQTVIGSYIGVPPGTTWSVTPSAMDYSPLFHCPTAKRFDKGKGATTLYMNTKWKVDDRSPWASGQVNGANQVVNGTPGLTQLQLVETGADQVWAIAELDQQFPGLGKPGWFDQVPPTPVHRKHRNAIFFDLHVGPLDLENEPL
jgi:prepilin-type N-terminal cleavage/methylation domain-containing protein